MGIQDINSFLREAVPQCFGFIKPNFLRGRRVVIDGSNWVCVNAPGIYREAVRVLVDPVEHDMDRAIIMNKLLHQCLSFNQFWFKNGVTPVWVWENGFPKDKEITKEERKVEALKRVTKVETLREELRAINPLFRPVQKLEELKKAMINCGRVTREECDYMQTMIKALGFPNIIPPPDTEADPMCAAICIELLAVAAWSTDTDHYAYGTPLLLTGFGPRDSAGNDILTYAAAPIIKHELKWTQEQLRELCIISGCDYNKRIPNYGVKKGLKLLQSHGWTIEGIASGKPELDITKLNHIRSRELLTAPKSGYTHDDPRLRVNRDMFLARVRDVCSQYGMEFHFEELLRLVSELPEPQMVILT